MNPVGYLTKYPDRLVGERGQFYDYLLAGNGLFIEAEGPLFAARVPVSWCDVRGLEPTEPKLALRYGKVAKYLFDLALNTMLTTPDKERYAAVTFSGGYHIYVPPQEGSGARVQYETGDHVLLDMHTHPKMPARFSSKDNEDETGLKLYAVIGTLGEYSQVKPEMTYDEQMDCLQANCPAVSLRVGVYGYFHPIAWKDVFDGDLGPEMIDLGDEKVGISRELLEEAYRDPGVPEKLKEDIERELHRDVDG